MIYETERLIIHPTIFINQFSGSASGNTESSRKFKMLLPGHKDYPEACGEIAKMIGEGTKARKRR